jgi:hypothetical protein
MANNMRKSPIVGGYLRWIEPLVVPLLVIPAIYLIGSIRSTSASLILFCLPIACIVLFRINLNFSKWCSAIEKTIYFVAAVAAQGVLVFFVGSLIPLVLLIAVGARSPYESISSASRPTQLYISLIIALSISATGVVFRLLVLVMEELRYLARLDESAKIAKIEQSENTYSEPATL